MRLLSSFKKKSIGTLIRIGLEILSSIFLFSLIFIAYGILPNKWYRVLSVYSGSMSPAINAGDLIVITQPPDELKSGMILTLSVNDNIVTHRLIRTRQDGTLITKGDANPTSDNWEGIKVKVIGVYWWKIPRAGLLLKIPSYFVSRWLGSF